MHAKAECAQQVGGYHLQTCRRIILCPVDAKRGIFPRSLRNSASADGASRLVRRSGSLDGMSRANSGPCGDEYVQGERHTGEQREASGYRARQRSAPPVAAIMWRLHIDTSGTGAPHSPRRWRWSPPVTAVSTTANDSYGQPWERIHAAAPRGDATWNDSSGFVSLAQPAPVRDISLRSGPRSASVAPSRTALSSPTCSAVSASRL